MISKNVQINKESQWHSFVKDRYFKISKVLFGAFIFNMLITFLFNFFGNVSYDIDFWIKAILIVLIIEALFKYADEREFDAKRILQGTKKK